MADGSRIRELRTRRGLLQRELAEMAGVTESAVRNYELGLRTPRPQHLEALAKALEVDPAALADYGLETSRDALEVLFRLEEGFGARPEADAGGAPVVVDPAAPGAQKLDAAVRAWARDAREAGLRGDLRGGVPRLEARVRRKVALCGQGAAFFRKRRDAFRVRRFSVAECIRKTYASGYCLAQIVTEDFL